MKKLLASLLVCGMLVSGCTQRNSKGSCVGLMDKDTKGAGEYEVSFWNAFLAVIFVETVIVPIVVVGYMLECPVE
jgi:hypothetical protein